MAKKPKSFEQQYPLISLWVLQQGTIEIGQDGMSKSFIRVLDEGGTVWEGKRKYKSLDAALADAEAGIEEWDDENGVLDHSELPEVEDEDEGGFVEVESSMIRAVRYHAKDKELEVIFNSGSIWIYSEVPKSTYQGLLKADSKGSYMRGRIIGEYPERQSRRR
jgi:hypothetical protein